jgi:hypothetical protein
MHQDGEFTFQIYTAFYFIRSRIIVFMFMGVVRKVWLHIMPHAFTYRQAGGSKVSGTGNEYKNLIIYFM